MLHFKIQRIFLTQSSVYRLTSFLTNKSDNLKKNFHSFHHLIIPHSRFLPKFNIGQNIKQYSVFLKIYSENLNKIPLILLIVFFVRMLNLIGSKIFHPISIIAASKDDSYLT